MALVKCRECGHMVSPKAKTCPSCGIDNPGIKAYAKPVGWGTIISIIFLTMIISAVIIEVLQPKKESQPQTPEQTRKEQIAKSFSNYDGRHYTLSHLVKQAMNDPDSFEHVKTTYQDNKDHLTVNMQYRGKNAFGATVVDEIAAKVGLDGEIIEIIDASPQEKTGDAKKLIGWYVNEETNPIDDSKTVTLHTESETGTNSYGKNILLIIRCKSNKTELFINWDDYLGLDETRVVTRVDDNQAQAEQWHLSTDSKATFRKRPIAFIKSMLNAEKLIVQTTPYRENPITAAFVITGLDDAIKPLRTECQW